MGGYGNNRNRTNNTNNRDNKTIGIMGNRDYKNDNNNRANTNKSKWETIFIEYENKFKFNAKFRN